MSSIQKDPSKGLFTRLLDRVESTAPSEIGTVREGEVVGDFKLVELLGRGGMGQVWAAEQLSEGLDLLAAQVGDTHWRSSAALSSLGAAMAGQGRHEEAESLLLESAETLMADDSLSKGQRYLGVELVPTAIQRIVDFYAAWHAAAPTEGHDKQAAEWRGRLSKWKQEEGQ